MNPMQAGAPSYPVFTGRRDCLTTSVDAVDFPSPSISWQQGLAYFQSKGLDVLDMATLLGKLSKIRTIMILFLILRSNNLFVKEIPHVSLTRL